MACGYSSMVERYVANVMMRIRFSLPAPKLRCLRRIIRGDTGKGGVLLNPADRHAVDGQSSKPSQLCHSSQRGGRCDIRLSQYQVVRETMAWEAGPQSGTQMQTDQQVLAKGRV